MAEHSDQSNGSTAPQGGGGGGGDPEVARLQSEIEQTREQLGQTVDALQAKLDVKTRVRASLTDDRGRPTREVQAGGAALVLIVVLVVWRKRRKA